LEVRTFFDVATFSVDDPTVGQSYGVTNQASAANSWTQQYVVTQSNVPDHSHTMAAIHANVMVNVNPITGQCVDDSCCGGCCSGGDDSSDYGWIKVYCNGQLVQDNEFGSGTPTTSDNYYGGVFLDQGAQTDTWEIDTSSNVWISVDSGEITTGTYAGFSDEVKAVRGGQDGSVELSLDGSTRGVDPVFVEMPDNGVINLNNATPDSQLPNSADGKQPYYTITGPPGIVLDTADSNPSVTGFNIYEIPMQNGATTATIGIHMVTPFWGADYNNGVSVSVQPIQVGSEIPFSAGWFDANADIFWAPSAGPPAQGLQVSDHVTGYNELPAATILSLGSAMSQNPSNVGALVASMDSGLSAAMSQYDHDKLFQVLMGVGGKIPNVRTISVDKSGVSYSIPGQPASNVAGSLWAWAQAGVFSPTVTEQIGLSKVDEDTYGSVDFSWSPAAGQLCLADPTFSFNPAGTVYSVDVSGIGLDTKFDGEAWNGNATQTQTFNVVQGQNGIVIDLAGRYKSAIAGPNITIYPEQYVNGVLALNNTMPILNYTSNFSVNYL
jgi:hypothetical protein